MLGQNNVKPQSSRKDQLFLQKQGFLLAEN